MVGQKCPVNKFITLGVWIFVVQELDNVNKNCGHVGLD
jgi:hypothetical protein